MLNRFFAYYDTKSAGDRGMLACIGILTFVFGIIALIQVSLFFAPEMPAHGGKLSEGVIGSPRFINPLLAVTQTDRDLTALLYAGLMRPDADGNLVPNIAESVTLSDDGRTYTIHIRPDAVFSDGSPLTSEDVVYTITKMQDPLIAATMRANWDGIATEIISAQELTISLSAPYTPFIENLTFGILPAHIWNTVAADQFPYSPYNAEPIGAGPYVIDSVQISKDGIPLSYVLVPNEAYHLETPRLAELTLRFYVDDEKRLAAYRAEKIQSMPGIDANLLRSESFDEDTTTITHDTLPRTFALFFNQNKSAALRDHAARDALDRVLDREALTADVLGAYGTPLTGPIAQPYVTNTQTATPHTGDHAAQARAILTEGGWTQSAKGAPWEKMIDGATTTLTFSIATIDTDLFSRTAKNLKDQFALIDVPVEIHSYTRANITDNIIRTRDYESLLFGTANGRYIDLYPFWHSSRRLDPGINVALYANIEADKLLADIRTATSTEATQTAYTALTSILAKDTPALFLFSPHFTYVLPENLHYQLPRKIIDPSERFSLIHEWYTETDKIWNIFGGSNK